MWRSSAACAPARCWACLGVTCCRVNGTFRKAGVSERSFEQGAIKVDQDLDEDGTIGRPKSKYAYRTIRMADAIMAMLKEWEDKCPASDLDLVFPNWQGNPEKLQNVYRRCWYTLQKDTGFVDKSGDAKYPLKELRHIRASLEIEKQANPKEIQELLGHSSIKIT
jgi:integrase